MRRTLIAMASVALLGGCSVVGIRSGSEEPAYTVVETIAERVEIRQYPPRLAVQTTVDAAGAEGRNEAFQRLFDYISGANQPMSEVAMTVPVEVGDAGATIEMTAPVERGLSNGVARRCASSCRPPTHHRPRLCRAIHVSHWSSFRQRRPLLSASAERGTTRASMGERPSSSTSWPDRAGRLSVVPAPCSMIHPGPSRCFGATR